MVFFVKTLDTQSNPKVGWFFANSCFIYACAKALGEYNILTSTINLYEQIRVSVPTKRWCSGDGSVIWFLALEYWGNVLIDLLTNWYTLNRTNISNFLSNGFVLQQYYWYFFVNQKLWLIHDFYFNLHIFIIIVFYWLLKLINKKMFFIRFFKLMSIFPLKKSSITILKLAFTIKKTFVIDFTSIDLKQLFMPIWAFGKLLRWNKKVHTQGKANQKKTNELNWVASG